MFISPAYAQGAETGNLLNPSLFIPLILMFIIMYFLVLRPQRQQMKRQQEMLNAVRRGDTVITGGGLIGKVAKVYDDIGELDVDLAEGVRVRVVRSTLATVRSSGEPVTEDKTPAKADKKKNR